MLTPAQRQQYFDSPLAVLHAMKRLKTATNQMCFLVSYGYFRAMAQLYSAPVFHTADLRYVGHALGWPRQQVRATAYAPEKQLRHRQLIRTLYQFRVWDHSIRILLRREAMNLARFFIAWSNGS